MALYFCCQGHILLINLAPIYSPQLFLRWNHKLRLNQQFICLFSFLSCEVLRLRICSIFRFHHIYELIHFVSKTHRWFWSYDVFTWSTFARNLRLYPFLWFYITLDQSFWWNIVSDDTALWPLYSKLLFHLHVWIIILLGLLLDRNYFYRIYPSFYLVNLPILKHRRLSWLQLLGLLFLQIFNVLNFPLHISLSQSSSGQRILALLVFWKIGVARIDCSVFGINVKTVHQIWVHLNVPLFWYLMILIL